MITKQQIQDCNDGQQLADWAAEYCMGWLLDTEYDDWLFHGSAMIGRKFWQPHQPTETGKAQAIDLAEKYDFGVYPKRGEVYFSGSNSQWEDTWQIAVLKSALLSAIGDSDE